MVHANFNSYSYLCMYIYIYDTFTSRRVNYVKLFSFTSQLRRCINVDAAPLSLTPVQIGSTFRPPLSMYAKLQRASIISYALSYCTNIRYLTVGKSSLILCSTIYVYHRYMYSKYCKKFRFASCGETDIYL